MIILGIESSCDETGASVIDFSKDNITVLANVVASSMKLHSKTGGIIPEIAAREQIKYILPVIEEALETAHIKKGKSKPNIDAIAVTVGPGLIGSLLVGVETARVLSLLWNIPLIPVNHLFGHIYANFIENKKIPFPAMSLIVSGGHTDLVHIKNFNKTTWISGTRDDAAGEAFDKIGRILHLPYPAGPHIEKLALDGNPKRFYFPRPLLGEDTFDFSFSGLKTAVYRQVQKLSEDYEKYSEGLSLDEQTIKDIAKSTQDSIVDVLVKKTIKAAKKYHVQSILLGGGVAANQYLRDKLHEEAQKNGFEFFVPQKSLCTDNGTMIAIAGALSRENVSWKDIAANPELYFDKFV